MKNLIIIALCSATLFSGLALAYGGSFTITIQNNSSQNLILYNGPGETCMDISGLEAWTGRQLASQTSTSITLVGDGSSSWAGKDCSSTSSLVNVRVAALRPNDYTQCSFTIVPPPYGGPASLTWSGCADGNSITVSADPNSNTLTINEKEGLYNIPQNYRYFLNDFS